MYIPSIVCPMYNIIVKMPVWCMASKTMYIFNYVGFVEISPSVSGVAPVCRMGDELVLTCTISGFFQRWQFTATLANGRPMNFMPEVTAGGSGGVSQPLMVNSTRFTLSRLSTQPLISKMTISLVSLELDGVEITCSDIETSESAATTILVIGSAGGMVYCVVCR